VNVGILEICTKNHYLLVESWSSVLKYRGLPLHHLLVQKVLENVSPQESVQVLRSNFLAQIFQIRKWFDRQDLVIVTSLQSKWFLFLWLSFFDYRCKVWIQIHNAKSWSAPSRHPWLLPKLKSTLRNFVRSRWLKKADALFVCSKNMKSFLDENQCAFFSKVHVFPFRVSPDQFVLNTQVRKSLKIVIPGMLSKKRRNYQIFQFIANEFRETVELFFLGAPKQEEGGLELLMELKAISEKTNCKIHLFSTYVSDQDFQNVMNQCDLVFAQINTEYRHYDYVETYGLTKDSGVSYAMVVHALPGLFNESFRNLQELADSTLYYQDDPSATEIIRTIINNPDQLQRLKWNALENSKKFQVDAISRNLDELFA